MNPLVTIIMATYNRAHLIEETLVSIQNQTYPHWECLIVDDGSTDDTFETLKDFIVNDTRFQYFKRPEKHQKGLPGCRNFGLDNAKGEFIIFFDDDDIVHPLNLEIGVRELHQSNFSFLRYLRDVFVGTFSYEFDMSMSYDYFEINKTHIGKILTNEIPLNSCAVLWKKECFENNRFVENLMYAEEWELYSRIISDGFVGKSINKVLFFGRKHPNSNTGEFYKNNPIRRKSKADAIGLVIKQLHKKQLLNRFLVRYFVQLSLQYKEFKLFSRIMKAAKINFFEQLYWYFIYLTLPYRLKFLRLIKRKAK